MGQQLTPVVALRPEFVTAKKDVIAGRERVGIELAVQVRGAFSCVNAHIAEVRAETWFHEPASGWRQRRAGGHLVLQADGD
jgi:hypothetical protein